MATSKIKNYAEEILALLTGDKDKSIAAKNARKVNAVVKGQISALESLLVDQENTLEEAKEAFTLAKYPTTPIASGTAGSKQYIDSFFSAHNAVLDAEEDIEDTKNASKVLKDFLKEHKF